MKQILKSLTLFLFLSSPLFVSAGVIFVDHTAAGANTGNNWNNAFIDIQDAIDAAVSGDRIWVAKGTYFPSQDSTGNSSPSDNRMKTFLLKDGVKLLGGFNGSETNQSQRNHKINKSILSGDIGILNDSLDNCYRIISGYYLGPNTSFSGFYIKYANGDHATSLGAGLYLFECEMNLTNLVVQENYTLIAGALTLIGSSIVIKNSSFIKNSGKNAVLLDRGDTYNDSIKIVNCVFFRNTSFRGVYRDSIGLDVINCNFIQNLYYLFYNATTDTLFLRNCIFWENESSIAVVFDINTLVMYSCVYPVINDEISIHFRGNCTSQQPRFVDIENLNFNVSPCSPIIDVGSNDQYPYIGDTDHSLNPRIINGQIDIGAVEFTGTTIEKSPITLYVDQSATGSGDGLTWANAQTSLKTVLDDLATLQDCVIPTIYVAEGVYQASETSDRTESFMLNQQFTMLGGFPPGGGFLITRDPATYKTILSGEIGGNSDDDNTAQILTIEYADSTSWLDGFFIQDGYNNYLDDDYICTILSTDIAFSNLVVRNNYSGSDGLFRLSNCGIATFNQCRIDSNDVSVVMSNSWSHTELKDCSFQSNEGGNMVYNGYISTKDCSIKNGDFTNLFDRVDTLILSNTLIFEEVFHDVFDNIHYLSIKNSTIHVEGLNLIGHVSNYSDTASIIIHNSIISGDLDQELSENVDGPIHYDIRNSMLKGNYPGEMNPIEGPPRFQDEINGDFQLSACSNGINAGDPALYEGGSWDLNDQDRYVNQIDLGAFENQIGVSNPKYHINIYVDSSATGNGSGQSWQNARTDLKPVLDQIINTNGCAIIDTVFVAKGTYIPESSDYSDRKFRILYDLVLLGGFPSGGSTIEERDYISNPTTLSPYTGELLFTQYLSNASRINGFHFKHSEDRVWEDFRSELRFDHNIITQNIKDESDFFPNNLIDLTFSNLSIEDCIFSQNDANQVIFTEGPDTISIVNSSFISNTGKESGAINAESPLVIQDCTFQNNESTYEGSGGVTTDTFFCAITNSLFIQNQSVADGGAIKSTGPLDIQNCIFDQNNSVNAGGAIFTTASDLQITNSLFTENTGVNTGGAIHFELDTLDPLTSVSGTSTIMLNTFNKNQAPSGSCIYSNGTNDSLILNHNIFWNNGNIFDISTNENVLANYNIIKSNQLPNHFEDGGLNIFNEDPKFLDSSNPLGADGQYMTEDDGLITSKFGSAFNNGNKNLINSQITTDLKGGERIFDDEVDIGAYEFSCILDKLYVNPQASGNEDGTSWEDATNLLSLAMELTTNFGCLVDSVFISSGTHLANWQNDPSKSIRIPSGATLIGGYNIVNGQVMGRDPIQFPSIISGNIGNPSLTLDNSKRLINILSYNDTTRIIGLHFAHSIDSLGSAIYLPTKSGNEPVIFEDIVVHNNSGVYPIYNQVKMVLLNSTIESNKSPGGFGRGIQNDGGQLLIQNTTFNNLGNFPLFAKEISNLNNGQISLKGLIEIQR